MILRPREQGELEVTQELVLVRVGFPYIRTDSTRPGLLTCPYTPLGCPTQVPSPALPLVPGGEEGARGGVRDPTHWHGEQYRPRTIPLWDGVRDGLEVVELRTLIDTG